MDDVQQRILVRTFAKTAHDGCGKTIIWIRKFDALLNLIKLFFQYIRSIVQSPLTTQGPLLGPMLKLLAKLGSNLSGVLTCPFRNLSVAFCPSLIGLPLVASPSMGTLQGAARGLLFWVCLLQMETTEAWVTHNDVTKWKHFPRYWPFMKGIQRSSVDSPKKGQWRGALIFSLICAWTNGWANNWCVGDLRCHRAYYSVTVMKHQN